ncbi:heavy metal translocatin [Metschnikowia bicuspidata var. bicuspidata NRRL YB-4993]|uniref:Heavy metal translocatin n=1 Tax=Metschnikowia bicuspidata var. bicuspidata NRRL YB-4993 TaxID=869754 RepID=A0A1A0H7Z1_9ASCO|nr:heavy metal translocatin [Metschnikowia bicuspidata var. bicuspidata NRRL YB-4993]OBA20141.1 heavy metal translocatin [Metschnikowia bicuspidata var. bicuspidata NRRL YB-4993]
MLHQLKISIGNVHCSDCEVNIRQTLGKYMQLRNLPTNLTENQELLLKVVYFNLDNGVINLYYRVEDVVGRSPFENSVKQVIQSLKKSGFSVLFWNLDHDGKCILSSQTKLSSLMSPDIDLDARILLQQLWQVYKKKQTLRHHMNNCNYCQMEKQKESSVAGHKLKDNETSTDDHEGSVETLLNSTEPEYRVVISISGMSCVPCVASISEAIAALFKERGVEKKNDEPQFSVNLLQQSAIVLVPNKQMVNQVLDVVESTGFTARLLEVLPIQRSVNQKIIAVIGGLTCTACVNAAMSAANDLPFVLECGISAVTKSGQFILEGSNLGDGKRDIEKLKESIEDCGFEFKLVKDEKVNFTTGQRQSRSINIGVDGMFCTKCPTIIMSYLTAFGEAVVIEEPITLDQPFVQFTYIPNYEEKVTVRRFLFDLNHLKPLPNEEGYVVDPDSEGIFKCNVIETISIDEHLRKILKLETKEIVRRLVIAAVLAIPSFVFGIVGMSLISKKNSFRIWLEEPIWAGNVSRVLWILLFLSTPVYFFAADIFHVKALKEIRSLWIRKNSFKKRFFKFGSMSLLMSLGTTVAYIASIALLILSSQQEHVSSMGSHTTYFDSVVFLTFFLLIGRLLESLSKSKTSDAVANLSSMKASQATIVEQSERLNPEGNVCYINDEVVDVKLLDSGDYIKMSTGESPAVDCVLVEGSTSFDESALTGESDPIKHKTGHQVFSGTVNMGHSAVIARILNVDGTSLIDQIVSTVRDGQMRKAPIQRLADVLTGYFVPCIVVIAIVTWIVWLSLAYSNVLPDSYLDIDVGGWTVWSLEFAIAVFVIACPCGIGLAAPTALLVGSGLAAKYGILAKGGGAAFQDAAQTNLICFDKTGTLTQGKMKVTDAAFVSNGTHEQLLRTFALQLTRDLELASKHPIATAIKEFLTSDFEGNVNPTTNKIPQVETVAGKGLKGVPVIELSEGNTWSKFLPEEVILGNEAILTDHHVSLDEEQNRFVTLWQSQKKSVVSVAIKCLNLFKDSEFHLILMLACRDELRPESKGIQCWMITGDNKLTAAAIGKEVGIDPSRIISGVLPNEKQAKVQMLREEGNTVAMVGDGINDAPALACADVGIALSSGADIAVTSSDFILLGKAHPLVTLFTLFDLAKVVFRRIKFNFGWSLVYNLVGVPIAVGVIYPYKNLRLSPVWASAAMAASSVSVVTSSLLLRLYKPKVRSGDLSPDVDHTEQNVNIYQL